jgi:sigma-B regulation protein RsbU (phosphoserine phosphatase)
VQLEFGDLLLLYTDGITETWDASGEQLGQERLLTIVRGLPVGSAAAVGQHLLSAVERFRGSVPVADDETVLVLERREGAK